MILDHITQGSSILVVASTGADAFVLSHRNLHMIDVFLIPQRFEDGIGKAHDQEILDSFLAEVVIDTKKLALVDNLRQSVINGTGTGQVPAPWVFHNYACLGPLRRLGDEASALQLLDTGDNQLGRNSEIEHAIAWNAEFIFDLFETVLESCKDGGILEGAWHVKQRPRKVRPARELKP